VSDKYVKTSNLQMKYFVLKPSGDNVYAKASRKAMQAYAEAVKKEAPEFAQELFEWVGNEGGWCGVENET
jgi:hypothetical protein